MSNHCNCLCELVGRKVIIYSCRCKYVVVVCSITSCLLEGIEVRSGCKKLFNLECIDTIEPVCC